MDLRTLVMALYLQETYAIKCLEVKEIPKDMEDKTFYVRYSTPGNNTMTGDGKPIEISFGEGCDAMFLGYKGRTTMVFDFDSVRDFPANIHILDKMVHSQI